MHISKTVFLCTHIALLFILQGDLCLMANFLNRQLFIIFIIDNNNPRLLRYSHDIIKTLFLGSCKTDNQNFINVEYGWLNIEHIFVFLQRKCVYFGSELSQSIKHRRWCQQKGNIYTRLVDFLLFSYVILSWMIAMDAKDAWVCLKYRYYCSLNSYMPSDVSLMNWQNYNHEYMFEQ